MIETIQDNPAAATGAGASLLLAARWLWGKYGPSLRQTITSLRRETPPANNPDVLTVAGHYAALRAHYLATGQAPLARLMDDELAAGVFRTAEDPAEPDPPQVLRVRDADE